MSIHSRQPENDTSLGSGPNSVPPDYALLDFGMLSDREPVVIQQSRFKNLSGACSVVSVLCSHIFIITWRV